MSKKSLLEVDFDHLAWKPVDDSVINNHSSAIMPLEMARGTNEVYLKCTWDDSSPQKFKEIIGFNKIFEELDARKGDKGHITKTFLPFVNGGYVNSMDAVVEKSKAGLGARAEKKNKNKKIEAPVVQEKSIDELIDEALGMTVEELEAIDGDINDADLDQFNQMSMEVQDPSIKYKFYVINIEHKTIDSGWVEEEGAKNRLAALNAMDAVGYSIEPYSMNLLKLVGDPTTMEWTPEGVSPFYVVNKTGGYVDSAYDDIESAKNRINEISKLIEDFETSDKEEFPDNEIDDAEAPGRLISDTYAIYTAEDALSEIGLSVTYKDTYFTVEDLIKKVEKELKNLLTESVLTESSEPELVDHDVKFYLVFGFDDNFNHEDDSMRVGSAEEYSELEIYLSKIISSDSSVVVTGRDLNKAIDALVRDNPAIKKPYQSAIKMLNHTASYFHENLGFGSDVVDELSAEVEHLKSSAYNPKEEFLDNNPTAVAHDRYIETIANADEDSDEVAYIRQLANSLKEIPPVEDELTSNEEYANASAEKKLELYIRANYLNDGLEGEVGKLDLMLDMLKNVIGPILNASKEAPSLYAEIQNELEKFQAETSRISKKAEKQKIKKVGDGVEKKDEVGHALANATSGRLDNNPFTKGSFDANRKDKHIGVPFAINPEYKAARDRYNALANELKDSGALRGQGNEAQQYKNIIGPEYLKRYGVDYKTELDNLNKKLHSTQLKQAQNRR